MRERAETPHKSLHDELIRTDAVVIGAGIGGMYMVHCLRGMNMSVRGIEAGADVGGVWYWNRYPGARCDLMSVDYSYSFSEEVQQEWTWPEQFASQPARCRFQSHRISRVLISLKANCSTRRSGRTHR